MTADAPVRLAGVTKTYGRGEAAMPALRDVSLEFAAGTLTAVMGPSGSGKSTLLQVAAGLDQPDSGSVTLAGNDLAGLDETARTRLRRDRVSFVFQSYNLMPALTVRQNVALPALLAGRRAEPRRLDEVIARVGLTAHRHKRPGQLSGGQQQRVAIARAVYVRPAVVFADEPTGALDSHSAAEVLRLLREQVDAGQQTVVMVTHDPVAAAQADRILVLVDGRIVSDGGRREVGDVAAELARSDRWPA